MALQFKAPRIQREWAELPVHNQPLSRLINCLVEFCALEFGKDVLLTEIYRTQAEFDALYAETPPGLRPATSPHLYWKAVDLRSTLYTDAEIERMLAFLNTFRYIEGRPVSIYHMIAGNAYHFHVQYQGQA